MSYRDPYLRNRKWQNLDAIAEILREAGEPLTVRQIVERSNGRLPTRSQTPDTVVARDLSLAIKYRTDDRFRRVAPGKYDLRVR